MGSRSSRYKARMLSVGITSLLAGCAYVSPDAGQEAVLVAKPYIFGSGGVQPTPVHAGRQFTWMSTQVVYVDVQPQQFTIHFDDLMTSDGVPLAFDAVCRLLVTDSVTLVTRFGPKWYENNIQAEAMNRVRQAVRKHGMNDTAISTVAIDAIDAEVTKAIEDFIAQAQVPVKLIKFTVGKAHPPDAVKNQRIETAQQEQRILTEQQRKLAEDQRKAAETSRAAADNAYREQLGISGEQFVTLEQIKMFTHVCGENKSPCTFILGNGTPVLGQRR